MTAKVVEFPQPELAMECPECSSQEDWMVEGSMKWLHCTNCDNRYLFEEQIELDGA